MTKETLQPHYLGCFERIFLCILNKLVLKDKMSVEQIIFWINTTRGSCNILHSEFLGILNLESYKDNTVRNHTSFSLGKGNLTLLFLKIWNEGCIFSLHIKKINVLEILMCL